MDDNRGNDEAPRKDNSDLMNTSVIAAVDAAHIDNFLRICHAKSSDDGTINDSVVAFLKRDIMAAAEDAGFLTLDGDGCCSVEISGYLMRWSTSFRLGTEAMVSLFKKLDEQGFEEVRFRFNTPGGDIDYVHEAAMALREMKTKTIAYIDNLAASGGLWLASQCDHIIVSDMSSMGSLGVMAQKYKDDSLYAVIVRSKNAQKKNADPTTKVGRSELQQKVDYIESVMLADIAEGRGVTVKDAIANFGGGGMIYGKELVSVGLADEYRENLAGDIVDMKEGKEVKQSTQAASTANTEGVVAAERERAIAIMEAHGIELSTELRTHLEKGADPGVVAMETVARLKAELAEAKKAAAHVKQVDADRYNQSVANSTADRFSGMLNTPVNQAETASMVEAETVGAGAAEVLGESTAGGKTPYELAVAEWNNNSQLKSTYVKREWYLASLFGSEYKQMAVKAGEEEV